MEHFDSNLGGYRNADVTNLTNASKLPMKSPTAAIKGAPGKFMPEATGKGAGVGVGGVADMSGLAGQIFVGPYNVGFALRTGTLGNLSAPVWAGTAANILVTGWILNVMTNRPSPFDTFGLLSSAVAQMGFGMFLSPLPIQKSSASSVVASEAGFM